MKIQKKSDLELFFSKFRVITYKKRQIIMRAEDIPFGVFCIKKGYIRKYLISKEGQELTTVIFKPLDVFPLGWVINNIITEYYYETITPVEIWRAPKDEFIKFIKSNNEAFLKLISRLLNRLSAFSERMEYLAFGHAQTKVASILVICAERFGKKFRRNILIQLPLIHKDIASLIGLTRETVSIEMKRIERKGIIGHKGHYILVKNMNKLKNESMLDNP